MKAQCEKWNAIEAKREVVKAWQQRSHKNPSRVGKCLKSARQRSVHTRDFVWSVKIFLKSQTIFHQKLEIETLKITYIYWEYSKEKISRFPNIQKKGTRNHQKI